jgi:DNA-binding Lrp family transcriptional regulator
MNRATLDGFDRKILQIVQISCRIPTEQIAEQVGLSASAVQRRLKKMRADGVISSEIAVVNPSHLPSMMSFIAGLEIEKDNYKALAGFKKWAENKTQIQQIHYVTGSFDLLVFITAANAMQYDAFIEMLMEENPLIRRVTTHVVLDSPKKSFYLPVE